MTDNQWLVFSNFRETFKTKLETWNTTKKDILEEIRNLQYEVNKKTNTPEYVIENPLVYNTALDDITKGSDINLIVIGDNPGKDEQLTINQKYLVGQAGKLATGFFKKHSELNTDFRTNVIILNKTPIHSAKTAQLSYILKYSRPEVYDFFIETQEFMAEETIKLYKGLKEASSKGGSNSTTNPQIWLVGYSELSAKGIFKAYREKLCSLCSKNDQLFVYQHFSMNRFTIDLKNNYNEKLSLKENLEYIGTVHRNQLLGF